MITVPELLARKQLLLERLREDDPGPHEREQIERLLAQIDTALSLIEAEEPAEVSEEQKYALMNRIGR